MTASVLDKNGAKNVDEGSDVNDHAETTIDARVQNEGAVGDESSLRGNTAIVIVTSIVSLTLSLILIGRSDEMEVGNDGLVGAHVAPTVAA